jgi:hypothetical protein
MGDSERILAYGLFLSFSIFSFAIDTAVVIRLEKALPLIALTCSPASATRPIERMTKVIMISISVKPSSMLTWDFDVMKYFLFAQL